ncbi:MAG TPA: ribonuclease P protein component [Spirochaetota bacterium]|nr:ribonuclease P protein component [Spirochaetota bacterium]HOM38821.1 ribonuclease P protein component [Spirochaetota bacterium]HPQ49879.1 ribonuclease P protein component [Spirochaetota bacterium]
MKRNLKEQEFLFNKIKGLKKFEFIKNNGKRLKGRFYILNFIKGNKSFGIIVSKRVGNSVQRNYEKRIIRELIKKHIDNIPNCSIIFIRIPGRNGNFAEKNDDFFKLIQKIAYECNR